MNRSVMRVFQSLRHADRHNNRTGRMCYCQESATALLTAYIVLLIVIEEYLYIKTINDVSIVAISRQLCIDKIGKWVSKQISSEFACCIERNSTPSLNKQFILLTSTTYSSLPPHSAFFYLISFDFYLSYTAFQFLRPTLGDQSSMGWFFHKNK